MPFTGRGEERERERIKRPYIPNGLVRERRRVWTRDRAVHRRGRQARADQTRPDHTTAAYASNDDTDAIKGGSSRSSSRQPLDEAKLQSCQS